MRAATDRNTTNDDKVSGAHSMFRAARIRKQSVNISRTQTLEAMEQVVALTNKVDRLQTSMDRMIKDFNARSVSTDVDVARVEKYLTFGVSASPKKEKCY